LNDSTVRGDLYRTDVFLRELNEGYVWNNGTPAWKMHTGERLRTGQSKKEG
jgi:hypothetical protein